MDYYIMNGNEGLDKVKGLYRGNMFLISLLCGALLHCSLNSITSECITPYKFKDSSQLPAYTIPTSARFSVLRSNSQNQPIIYYFSPPKVHRYPIAILCTGSSNEAEISSVIHFHRYFLREFMDMNVGVITVERWGVDGNTIDKRSFMRYYTRSQRLEDHIAIIEHLKKHPPAGWDGQFIFLGVSEGGPLVTSLSERYQDHLIATINWCGAGHWNWREELWAFLQNMRSGGPLWFKIIDRLSYWIPYITIFPHTKDDFDVVMNETLLNPTTEKTFGGMTYKYHADALTYPLHDYVKLRKPFLVVVGALDSIIDSCDEFVQKATNTGANVTYLRIDDMDHFIRKRPDIIEQSFAWLKDQLGKYHPL